MQNCPLGKSGEEISGYLGLLYFLSRTGDHLMNSQACLWDAHSETSQPLFQGSGLVDELDKQRFCCPVSSESHMPFPVSVSSELT